MNLRIAILTTLLFFIASKASSEDVSIYSESQSKRIFVNVLGEVKRPDRFSLSEGSTVLDAFASAGGPTTYANLKKARIIRRGSDKVEEIVFDLKTILLGKLAPIALTDGDTIVITESSL
jgi:protein involved in polysaccharide export with SLBB domain